MIIITPLAANLLIKVYFETTQMVDNHDKRESKEFLRAFTFKHDL